MISERLRQRLATVLEECARHLPQGAVFLEARGGQSPVFGAGFCGFCRACLEDAVTAAHCRRAILTGAYEALQTGEPYFYRCWVGLNSVVFPVAPGGRLEGALEAGGFTYVGEGEESRRFVLEGLTTVRGRGRAGFEERLEGLRVLSALEVRGLADFLFQALFAAGVNRADEFAEIHGKYLQQRRIGERMHDLAGRAEGGVDAVTALPALGAALRTGDRGQAMLLLDAFFCQIMLASGLRPDAMKAHVQLLLALLTREAVAAGDEPLAAAFTRHVQALHELEGLQDAADICYWTSKRVNQFAERVTQPTADAPSLSARVAAWVEAHYVEPATLRQAARDLGASESSIVQTLRREGRPSFHAQVTEVRLREARRLLTGTRSSLAEIAALCGFCDAGHFSRRFREHLRVPPGRYRRLARSVR